MQRRFEARRSRSPHVPPLLRVALLAGIVGAASGGTAHAGLGTAVEFYNPKNNHYFLTANPAEAAALDAGTTVKGWSRTGGQFTVFTDPADGLSAVCRFFGTPGKGPDSHFYTADAAECAKVKTLPAWTFEEVAFYIPTTSTGNCGSNWPVYRSYFSDNVSDANHRFTVDLTAHVRMAKRRGDVLEGIVMCAPVSDEEREADVVRFLEQATFGPTEALVQEVKAKGIAKWLDEQIPMNVTRYTQYPYFKKPDNPLDCINDDTPPVTPEKYCQWNNNSPVPVATEFFRQANVAPDQLRLRAAHVWHQIFVVSSNGVTETYAIAEFEQRLRDRAFGTFESLLLGFALSPQLGIYQNWIQNLPEHDGVKPNENFARELMQLFTIGVNELNDDGTPRLDAAGKFIATYEQGDIGVMARVLTGYSFPTFPGGKPDFWNTPWYYIGDMQPFDAYHDMGAKSFLKGRVSLPANFGADRDFRTSIRGLIDHPNTPPFISKQLIQKTVTSSPTPGYVARVSAVFRNNGSGIRGDLAAVMKAILLDPEARGARKIDSEYGRLREPALFWTGMVRALDVTTDGWMPFVFGQQSGQSLFTAPTVFNYYPADYTLVGTNIPAPEFGIFNSAEFLLRVNQVNELVYNVGIAGSLWMPKPFVRNAVGTLSPALSAFLPYASNTASLIDHIDRLLLHGAMNSSMRGILAKAIDKLPASDLLARTKLAAHLTLTSASYQVQK